MQFRIYTLIGCWCLFLQNAVAQSQYIPLHDDYYHFIDRYEIRRGRLNENFHIGIKPFQRSAVVNFLDSIKADRTMPLNDTDFFNLDYLRQDSWEWSADRTPMSKKTLWKRYMFYPKRSLTTNSTVAYLLEIKQTDSN